MYYRFMNETRFLPCLPIRYKTIMKLGSIQPIPICQDSKKEIWRSLTSKWNKILTNCPYSCMQTEYRGKMKSLDGYFNYSKSTGLDYLYLSRLIEVHTEYSIYELHDVIGSVGGTLGLFIGFSFLGLLKYFFETVKNYLAHTDI